LPEIWLPYGPVEVVLNVKAENLGSVVEAPTDAMSEQAMQDLVQGIPKKSFVLTDGTNSSLDVLNRLVSSWQVAPKDVVVFTGERATGAALKRLAHFGYTIASDRPSADLGVVDGVLVRALPRMQDDDSLLICEARIDPVYGFRGAPSALTEALGLGPEAVKRWRGEPSPCQDTDPGWFAGRVAEEVKCPHVLEYVRSNGGMEDAFVGDFAQAHGQAVKLLTEKRQVDAGKSRLLVISPGGEGFDLTLHSSLAALGNYGEALGEDPEVVLLAEMAEGLGSAALRVLCDTGVRPESLSHYDGYEDVMLLKWFKSKAKLHVVSTLPRAILERRLGLSSPASLKQAVEDVEMRHGWKLKATIVKGGLLTAPRRAQSQ